jgi:hypothetical protein
MEDHRIDVLERLAAADPVGGGTAYDQERADRVLAAVLAAPRAKRGAARKRLVAAAVALLVVGVAAPALAFSDSVRTFVGLESPPKLEQATLLVSAPVAEGTVAHLWHGRTEGGGECFFETYSPPGDAGTPDLSGGICSDRPLPPSAYQGSVHVGVTKKPMRVRGAAAWVPPVVTGHLDPTLGAMRVVVEWNGGAKELAHANGHFIGAVEDLYEVPDELLPVRVVAYDADGREVFARVIDASWFRLE